MPTFERCQQCIATGKDPSETPIVPEGSNCDACRDFGPPSACIDGLKCDRDWIAYVKALDKPSDPRQPPITRHNPMTGLCLRCKRVVMDRHAAMDSPLCWDPDK